MGRERKDRANAPGLDLNLAAERRRPGLARLRGSKEERGVTKRDRN